MKHKAIILVLITIDLFLLGIISTVYLIDNKTSDIGVVNVSKRAYSQFINTRDFKDELYYDVSVSDKIFSRPYVDEIIDKIEAYDNKTSSEVFASIVTKGELYSYRGNTVLGSLSIIKIPVMIAVFDQLNTGQIDKSDFVSRYGYSGTVDQALIDMIQLSSNEATGALIKHIGGVDSVNFTMRKYFGNNLITYLDHTPGYAGIGDESFNQFNIMTTDELAYIMSTIKNLTLINNATSLEMLKLLEGTQDYFGIKTITEIDELYMKTGYYPYNNYSLVGNVEINSSEYSFAIYVYNRYGTSLYEIRDIMRIIANNTGV